MTRGPLLATSAVLVVSHLQRAIDFYAKLGFVEPATWGDPPTFGMMNRDGFDVMLSCSESGATLPVNASHGAWDLHLRIADVTAEEQALRAAGVAIDKGPTTTFYGMIEIEVLDPDGHRICFGQDVEPRDSATSAGATS
jgi:catechol 2,3-dioxygenase-like lactoylglutathione lyase family enzyme